MIGKNLENFFRKQERVKKQAQIKSKDQEMLRLFVSGKTQEEIQKIERWLLR